MEDASLKLTLKWSFIAVEYKNTPRERRANSEPPRKAVPAVANSDSSIENCLYLSTLWQRAQHLWLPSADGGGARESSYASGIVAPDQVMLQAAPSPTELSQADCRNKRSIVPNSGSAGHPEFCNRPCTFFPLGSCGGGKDCKFCHLEHPYKITNLDKINRGTLRSLSCTDRKNVLFSAMITRASTELPGGIFDQFLEMLRNLFGSYSSDAVSLESYGWRGSRLHTSLQRMPLIALFHLYQSYSNISDSTAKKALTQFRSTWT